MFPAWFSRGRRFLAQVICSQNPKRSGLLTTPSSKTPTWVRLSTQQAAPHPVCNKTPKLQPRCSLFTHEPPFPYQSSSTYLQFQKQANTPPGMRVRRPHPSVSPWMKVARWRRTDGSAVCAQSSPRSRSASWRRSSTSTNTWMLEKE